MDTGSHNRHPLVLAVARTLSDHDMVRKGDRVLVGFSGGPDSTALARALLALAPELGFSLGLAHLNHGLRAKAADRDEAFARKFADRHAIELTVAHRNIRARAEAEKRSLEETGRRARYALFKQVAQAGDYTGIATGHHRDDHREQVLLNLIRGTGPSGLRGIAPVREDGVIRPLIRVVKSQILDYLNALGQPHVTDASNQDPAFLRNRVRHQLIPFMEDAFNPDIRAGLDRLSTIVSLEDDYMEGQAEEALQSAVTDRESQGITLDLDRFKACHPAITGRIIRKAICHVKQDLRRISHRHIRDIQALAARSETGKHLDLPGRIRVYRLKNALCFRLEDLPLRALGRREKQDRTDP